MNKLYSIFIALLFSVHLSGCNSNIKYESVQKTKEQIKKSVVRIRSKNQMTGEKQEGSGFVIGVSDSKAYIITTSHVVEGDPNPIIEFFENQEFKTRVLDSEPEENGLALLLVEKQIPYEIMPLYLVKEKNLNIGDRVFTFGFPRGGARWSYDTLSYSEQKYRNLLFSDGNIIEGNSGCPVIKGEQVVAVITSVSVTNYAYAISADSIRKFLEGAKGGIQILYSMEKWKPSEWRTTQETRLEKAKFIINEQARLKEIEAKIADAKARLREAESKIAVAEQARFQAESEVKMKDSKTEKKLVAEQSRKQAENEFEQQVEENIKKAEQNRKQAEDEVEQAKEDIKKAEQQRILLQTNKNIFQDNLKDGGLGPKMVWIPKGNFRMGDIQGDGEDDEKPAFNVFVKRFAIGQYELTIGEFRKFVQVTKYRTDSEKGSGCQIWNGNNWKGDMRSNWQEVGFSQNENHPVTCINWYDAMAYIKWLKQQTGKEYRLPTELEWEYAARAGTKTKYWWGNNIGKDKANCDGCGNQWGDKRTVSADSFIPNDFGLYNMIGNLWEWTCSEYDNKYNGKEKLCLEKNVKNKIQFVLRGGSWGSKPYWIRSTNRHFYNPNTIHNTVGFRVVRE